LRILKKNSRGKRRTPVSEGAAARREGEGKGQDGRWVVGEGGEGGRGREGGEGVGWRPPL